MNQDDLKNYSVIVGKGSGCFFQPLIGERETYILTAKHLFEGENKDENGRTIQYTADEGDSINIIRQIKVGSIWQEEQIDYTFQRGVNYFPHKEADAAILIIGYLPNYNDLFIQSKIDSEVDFDLCGFPDTSRENNNGEKYRTHRIERFLASGNYCHSAQLFGGLNQFDIEGMSGGGILKIEGNFISIIGIQSKMANKTFPTGQIGFIPMNYFKEIVEYPEYIGKLEKLLPLYLKSFSFLENEIFQIKYGIEQKDIVPKLTSILKAEAKKIINGDITPLSIKDFLKEKLLLILAKQDDSELEKKKIWITWLELLTILNIAKSKNHLKTDLPELFKKFRLFYSDIDGDFFLEHLDDLPKLDYTGLENGGIVIVSSNCEALGNSHVLNLNKITTDITRLRIEYDIEAIGIDNAKEFPFDKYKYMNISAFKEGSLTHRCEEFRELNIPDCVIKLKQLYEQLIAN